MAEGDLRILTIDGGGVRGIAPLRILQFLKGLTNKEPHQMFDMICGTSTGGIIAILLGILKVPVDDCLQLYSKLGEEIFSISRFKIFANAVKKRERYSSEKLEKIMKDIIIKQLNDADALMSSRAPELNETPRVFVVSKLGDAPYFFRNYKDTNDCGTGGRDNAKIWEAARATSAALTYFAPLVITDPSGTYTFYDGGVRHNNPSEDALNEIGRIEAWKERKLKLFMSLGTGLASYPDYNGPVDFLKMIFDAATDCETTHQNIELQKVPHYVRCNPGRGLGDLKLDDAELVNRMKQITQHYIAYELVSDVRKMNEIKNGLMDVKNPLLLTSEEKKCEKVRAALYNAGKLRFNWDLRLFMRYGGLTYFVFSPLHAPPWDVEEVVSGVIALNNEEIKAIAIGAKTADEYFDRREWDEDEFSRHAAAVINTVVVRQLPSTSGHHLIHDWVHGHLEGIIFDRKDAPNAIRLEIKVRLTEELRGKSCAELGGYVWNETKRKLLQYQG